MVKFSPPAEAQRRRRPALLVPLLGFAAFLVGVEVLSHVPGSAVVVLTAGAVVMLHLVRRGRRARSGGKVVVWRAGEVVPVGSLPARRSAVGAVARRRAGALVRARRRPPVPAASRSRRASRRPVVVRPRWRGRPSGPGVMLLLLAVMAVAVVAAAWWLHRLGSSRFAVLLLVVGLGLVVVLLLASSRTTVHSMSAEALTRLLSDPRPATTPRPAAKPSADGQDGAASAAGAPGAASVVVVGVSNHPRAGTAAPSALPSAASTPAVAGSPGRYALPGDRASIGSGQFGIGAEVRR